MYVWHDFFCTEGKNILLTTPASQTHEDSRGSLHLSLRLVDTTSYLRLSVGKIQKVQYRAYYRMLAPFRHGCMPHLHPSVNFWQATFFRYEKLWHDKTKDEHLIRHALKRCTIYFPTCTTLFTVSIFPYRIVMCISSCSPCPKYIEIDHDILEYIVDHEILR